MGGNSKFATITKRFERIYDNSGKFLAVDMSCLIYKFMIGRQLGVRVWMERDENVLGKIVIELYDELKPFLDEMQSLFKENVLLVFEGKYIP